MATKESKLYRTGEMAKLFALKKDTLFYYDRIGLFSPKYRKGNTGYRYYDSGQIMLLDAIISLREMDISIPELKKYLKDMNSDVFLSLMELESTKIDAKIKDFTIKKKTISELAKRITKAKQSERKKLFITEEDRCYYLSEPFIRIKPFLHRVGKKCSYNA